MSIGIDNLFKTLFWVAHMHSSLFHASQNVFNAMEWLHNNDGDQYESYSRSSQNGECILRSEHRAWTLWKRTIEKTNGFRHRSRPTLTGSRDRRKNQKSRHHRTCCLLNSKALSGFGFGLLSNAVCTNFRGKSVNVLSFTVQRRILNHETKPTNAASTVQTCESVIFWS